MSAPLVVVGGGLAAGTLVTQLRERGYDGAVVLLADEAHAPYERPPLSKDLLLGKGEPADAAVHETQWYADHDVDLRTSTSATAIDLGGRRVRAGDEWLDYDTLVVATGARARHLPMADESGVPVVYLRTLDESLALREHLTEGARVGIIGGGWIGLEVASAARQHERRGDRARGPRPAPAEGARTRGRAGVRRPPPRARRRPAHGRPGHRDHPTR